MKPMSYLLLNCECNNDTMVVSYSPKTLEYFICCAQCGAHLATIPAFAFNYETDPDGKVEERVGEEKDEDVFADGGFNPSAPFEEEDDEY